jgi:GDP-4-dehydro-6-deoxy-D-mannose reductase
MPSSRTLASIKHQEKMKKLLVTGQTGFVGKRLAHLLEGHPQWDLVPHQAHDLTDPSSLDSWLSQGGPDAVIHLAGQTFVPQSVRDPHQTFEVNLLGTLNLLQALKRNGFCGTFLFVSSGDVYGQVEEPLLPIDEQLFPRPRNPYAVSKLSAELLCQQWSVTEPWRILIARPFNHIGPGQAATFVLPGIAEQLAHARLANLSKTSLNVGDVDVTRDFLHVDDVISAYLALLQNGRTGEIYNVCSGVERSVRALILELAKLAAVEVELTQDAARLRPADQRRVRGSSNKLRLDTGWAPTTTITETLQSILDDWQQRVRA